MADTLEPMPENERKILELALPPEPPPGAEARVLAHLGQSIAGAGAGAGIAAASMTKLLTLAAVAGGIGVGAGVALDRTVLAPPPPEPKIVERVVRVEVPAPAPPPQIIERVVHDAAPAPVVDARPAAPAPKPEVSDDQLRRERELIDTARSAMMRADVRAAVAALEKHQKQFNAGRLGEERDSLWVQALVLDGARDAARAKAQAFHRAYPNSLLGPVVDAAMDEAGTPQQQGMEPQK